MKNIAIVLTGAVSKVTGKLELPEQIYRDGSYVNFKSVYNCIQEHFVKPNKNYNFDFFIHCWNKDLQEDLVSLYNPKKFRFDDNNLYKQDIIDKVISSNCELKSFALTSHSLSIKFGCELIEQYVSETNTDYDLIIIYRPDILTLKDLILDNYDRSAITLDNYQDFRGEMHFVMSYESMISFKNIWDTISVNNPPKEHCLFKNYIEKYTNIPLKQDNIVAGIDEAPLRYINVSLITTGIKQKSDFYKYGLTDEELDTYINIY